jgi:alcohol dehydrogenase class IV
MRFEFATATRIIFGEGTAATLPELVRSFGTRPFVVTGASSERAAWLVSAFSAESLAVHGEPTVDLVRDGARRVREAACDVVVAVGGGSAIDAGKAISIVATNGGEPLDFLEVVGKGRNLSTAPLPFIAVPTTAGTGSEVTRNAVLASPEHGVKASLRSPMMLPRVALVDPELTYSLPSAITAYTGLDALTQLIEPYVSARAKPRLLRQPNRCQRKTRNRIPSISNSESERNSIRAPVGVRRSASTAARSSISETVDHGTDPAISCRFVP